MRDRKFKQALYKGLKAIGESIGVPDLSFYWGRHTFGNLARNKCRKTKYDVALALNHVDRGRRTTDIYLEKDRTIVDEVQEAVIAFVMNSEKPEPIISMSYRLNWQKAYLKNPPLSIQSNKGRL